MNASISHILFATDLSLNSIQAARQAAWLADTASAKLHVLHVVEPMSDDVRITIQMFIQDESERKKALTTRAVAAKVILDERQKAFLESIPEDSDRIREHIESSEVVEGHPAEVILRRAKELNCDLIVLGAHSHGLSQTFLGSVAKRILRRARIPTIVVPCVNQGVK